MFLKKLFSQVAVLSFLIVNTSDLVAREYNIIEIGSSDWSSTMARDINDKRQITGQGTVSGATGLHAFRYDAGSMQDLGSLGGTTTIGRAINSSGHIAGHSNTTGEMAVHATLYDGNTLQDLGTLGGTDSLAEGINDNGQIAGWGWLDGDVLQRAFIYENGSMTEIGTLGGDSSIASDINNNGQISGYSQIAGNSTRHAFLYQNGSMTDLGTLGGTESIAQAINSSGQITGHSKIAGDAIWHAFLYDNGAMMDLGVESQGWGINDHGNVVGRLGDGNTARAFIYDGSSILDLCTLTDCSATGWDYLHTAMGINNNGDITGWGYIDGVQRAFLVSAVPIPPALWLFGSGLFGLIGVARRRES